MVKKIPPDRDDGAPTDDADVARELQTEEPNSTSQGNASASAAVTTGANTVNYIESAQTQCVIPKTPTKPNPPAASANTPGVTVPPSPNGRKYRALYEDMQARYLELQKEYESAISEKDATINQLNKRLETPAVMKMNNKDIFVAKPKKGAKPVSSSPQCTMSGCDKTNIDLIKCNMCGNLVCEDCSGVKVTKLRPVMNMCNPVYFICRGCDALMKDTNEFTMCDVLQEKVEALTKELHSCEEENGNLTEQVSTLEAHQTSLKTLLEERETALHDSEAKLVSLEQNATGSESSPNPAPNLEELINQRFDKIDKNIDELIEHKLANVLAATCSGAPANKDSKKLFSAVVGSATSSENHVAVLKTSRNAEMIEKQEQEKRANNIVIHGISEERLPEVTIQNHDQHFLTTLLQAIEVDVQPKQILRLGNETADKKRPVKVILNSANDKQEIMSNLSKLKNADASLRGISVRDDYTIEERKLIKTMNEEAKRKNEAENVTHWKVRGSPKNGLRVVKVTTRKSI